MANESEIKNGLGALARVKRCAHEALFGPLRITPGLLMLAIALVEALVAPLLGVRWAWCSLAMAGCAVGYTLFACMIWLQHVGARVDELWREELGKTGQPPRRSVPEQLLSRFKN